MNIKFVLSVCLSLIVLLCCLCSSRPKDDYDLSSIFAQDSGYIDRKGLLYIFPKFDTINFEIPDFGTFESDNYGKYYKDDKSGRYIAIVYNPKVEYNTSIQVISVDLVSRKIDEGKGFLSWYYDASSQISNFRKIGQYYYLPTNLLHGTDCAANGFYLFRDINVVGSPIYEEAHLDNIIAYFGDVSMTDFKIIDDTLKIKYTVDSGVYEKVNDNYNPKMLQSKEWIIDYDWIEDDWVAKDSTLFKTENMFFFL